MMGSEGGPIPAALLAPLDQLLVSGSDNRLALDQKTRLNSYGCAAVPQPATISFASTTASSISTRGFAAARAAHAHFVGARRRGDEYMIFDRILARLRTRLKQAFAINDPEVETVLAPSGTDAQLAALFIARATLGAPITSIVVGAEETGSGTRHTVRGQHFASVTAHGIPVAKGEVIEGFDDIAAQIDVPVRNRDGTARGMDEIDASVMAAIGLARAEGQKVLLIAMDQSKSGLGGPSNECLRAVRMHWNEDVEIVVDACQGRIAPKAIDVHLAEGRMVLMTGSKFYSGPPFSGAVFVPPRLADRLEDVCEVPAGLCDYSGRSEWPTRWTGIRAALPDTVNAGMWLRWEAALAEIEAYNAVPHEFRALALNCFAQALPATLAEFSYCQAVDSFPPSDALRTIYPFVVIKDGEPLSCAAARIAYNKLNDDLSADLPTTVGADERDLASRLCHIGQPFALRSASGREIGALRISADARLISNSWQPGDQHGSMNRIDRTIDGVRTVLEKIGLILQHHNFKELN